MFQLKKEQIHHLLDKFFYTILLGIGIYFIYLGDIIPRFRDQRTNFAVYSEEMNELPTISSYINKAPANLTHGQHFNLSLGGQFLQKGRNFIKGLNLTVDLEHAMPGQMFHAEGLGSDHWFQIRPMSFSLGMAIIELTFKYSFEGSLPGAQIGMYLSPENNSHCWCRGKFYDGEKMTVLGKVGDWFNLDVQPQKFLHLREGSCRERPYVQELAQHMEAEIHSEKYKKICKPKDVFWECAAVTTSEKVNHLPFCRRK